MNKNLAKSAGNSPPSETTRINQRNQRRHGHLRVVIGLVALSLYSSLR